MIRFLHTADWQLGMTRHFLGPDAQPRFTAARLDAVARIGRLAVEHGCGFVVVCGDVFESNHVERRVVVRALEAMGATPEVTFYLLPGNHDPLDATSVFRSPTFVQHRPGNVVVLDGSDLIGPAPGVELVAAPWTSKRPLVDLPSAASAELAVDGTIRVVVGHGAVDTLSPDPDDPALISVDRLRAQLDRGAIHYVALGDRHSTTDVAAGRIWYAGAPEPTDYDEVDPGNVLLVELGAGSCEVSRVPVGTWSFVRRHVDLTGEVDVDELQRWLDSLPDKADTIVKLSLVGQLSLAEMARLDVLLDHHADLLGALETWERRTDLVVVPDADDLDHLGLAGFARDALDDLRNMAATDQPDAVVARDALGLLYRLGSPAA